MKKSHSRICLRIFWSERRVFFPSESVPAEKRADVESPRRAG